jgi:hypothetical protein
VGPDGPSEERRKGGRLINAIFNQKANIKPEVLANVIRGVK